MDKLELSLKHLEAEIDHFINEHKKKNISNINLPKKLWPHGSDWFNDYVHGYNDCIDDIKRMNGV